MAEKLVGKDYETPDLIAKVTGKSKYSEDFRAEGVDLVAIAPFALVLLGDTDIRSLATVRLLRFFKLARYSPGLASLVEAVRIERRGLLACFVVICGGVLIVTWRSEPPFSTSVFSSSGRVAITSPSP